MSAEKLKNAPKNIDPGDDCDISMFKLHGDVEISTESEETFWFVSEEDDHSYIRKELVNLSRKIERSLISNGIFIRFPFGDTGNQVFWIGTMVGIFIMLKVILFVAWIYNTSGKMKERWKEKRG